MNAKPWVLASRMRTSSATRPGAGVASAATDGATVIKGRVVASGLGDGLASQALTASTASPMSAIRTRAASKRWAGTTDVRPGVPGGSGSGDIHDVGPQRGHEIRGLQVEADPARATADRDDGLVEDRGIGDDGPGRRRSEGRDRVADVARDALGLVGIGQGH